MTTGVLARGGGSKAGERRAALDTKLDDSVPPWRSWRTRSRAARAIRFVETYCLIPSGHNAGQLVKLAPYQKQSLEALLAGGVRTGGLQIPRGNAKSTLWAAVGLWALCDHEDSPQVPLVAGTGPQAVRTLMRPVSHFVRHHDDLKNRVAVYSSVRRVWSAWNDGELLVIPADADRLQGLNPTVALIDEAQTVTPEVFGAVLQGAGKRAESLVLAIGTPAPNAQTSALFTLRERHRAGAPITWVEYAADAGCAIDDRRQWHKANPALKAGLLFPDALAGDLELVSEAEFRTFRLGLWVDATLADWLPGSAWDDCPQADPPPAGADVVLGLDGTYAGDSMSLVGVTPDGAVFLAAGWDPHDPKDDDTVASVLEEAFAHWNVLELVVRPGTRAENVGRLVDAGRAVHVWARAMSLDVSSSTEWRRAIVEGRIAHDHDPRVARHVGALVVKPTPDGSLRLGAPDPQTPVDGARAALMAWWRALNGPELETPMVY